MAKIAALVLFLAAFYGLADGRKGSNTKRKCGFVKTLLDKKNCIQPEDIKASLSISVGKESCWSQVKIGSIKEKGCLEKKLLTRVCKGKCNSVWLPGLRYDHNRYAASACIGCFESVTSRAAVSLICPERKVKIIHKFISVVEKCKCQKFSCSFAKLKTKIRKTKTGKEMDNFSIFGQG